MSLPKEPRQKMINVMYLVLTALLALNVSSEILNAFKTVNNSLLSSNLAIDHKNEAIAKSFEELAKDPASKEKAVIWKPKAEKAHQLAEDVTKYLEGLKQELKKASKLVVDKDGKEHFSLDNLDAATHLLVEGPVGTKNGKELFQKLSDFKAQLLQIDPAIQQQFGTNLPLDLAIPETESKVGKGDWAYSYFHMTPSIAAITILSKFQNDVKNSEAQVADFCHQQVGKVKFVFDQFQAIASQSSEYLMPGQELKITGGVGAFSSAAKPLVTIDGAVVALNAQGVAEYKTTVGGPGSYSKKVVIKFKTPDGKDGQKDAEIKYTVGSPTGASVSADATKVFYIGLNNPISVSGGTKGDEATQASIDNGTLTKTAAGKYDVTVTGGTEANITVTVDGKSTPFKFRVKPIPEPVAMVGRSKGGRIPANEFKAQQGLRADLENFIFEGVKFSVSSYSVIAVGKGFTENIGLAQNVGAAFGAETRRIIDKAGAGTTITFDDIKAVGPDGRTRTLPPIPFNLY